ncbi:MAG TPA: Crp/Fnr family transcriptional regulator [Microvirga sp.]|nr:Crp/Fnr family transcriptional regulator [Microvirga sp.]
MNHSHGHPLIAKLDSIFTLTQEERRTLADLPMQVQELRTRQDIVREGDRPSRSCLLLEGFACRYSTTHDGKRQIMSFHIPGEMPDLQSLHLKTMDHSLQTITPCKVGFVTHETVRDLCSRYPRIGSALWRETLIDGAIFREWMINIGRREAYPRACHLLCEMMIRMRAVGLAQDHTCELPITQAEFADALSITNVHANRVLQEIRKDKLISLTKKTLKVLDWEGLTRAGEFDPTYLHLEDNRAAA